MSRSFCFKVCCGLAAGDDGILTDLLVLPARVCQGLFLLGFMFGLQGFRQVLKELPWDLELRYGEVLRGSAALSEAYIVLRLCEKADKVCYKVCKRFYWSSIQGLYVVRHQGFDMQRFFFWTNLRQLN